MISTKVTPRSSPDANHVSDRYNYPSPYDIAPGAKPFRVSYGRGLFLWVTPRGPMTEGVKSWRYEYTALKRRHMIVLGHFPQMSEAQAWDARADTVRTRRDGRDPLRERRAEQSRELEQRAMTFEAMARKWHGEQASRWSPNYAKAVLRLFERFAFPAFGKLPLASIRPRDVIELLRKVNAQSGIWQTTHLRQHLELAFDDWLINEFVERNPAHALTRLPDMKTPDKDPQPAVETIEAARRVLAKVEASDASPSLKLYHRFLALTGVRPSEARGTAWAEVRGGVWTIPAERMKGRRGRQKPHTVYLSRQAIEVLDAARTIQPGRSEYAFPGPAGKAPLHRSTLSETVGRALRGTDLEHVPHGWRATITTLLNEWHPERHHVIDAMLAHAGGKAQVAKKYDRTKVKSFRAIITALHQEWADRLLEGAHDAFALIGLQRFANDDDMQLAEAAD